MDNSGKTQHNVVTMTDHLPHNSYAPLSLVEAYWDALRAGREMPKRAEIDPRGIESALEYAFILERVAPGVARMRIAGTHLHDIMGMEARGMPLTAFFEHACRTRVAGLLEEVFQTPGTGEITMQSHGSLGQPALEARMVLLPLKSDLGDVSRILGCIVCQGELGTVPRRFDIKTAHVRRLSSAPAMPRRAPAQKPRAARQEFAEAMAPFAPKAAGTKTAPIEATGLHSKRPAYLRLVKNDD